MQMSAFQEFGLPELEPNMTLGGFLDAKAFLCPHLLFLGHGPHSATTTFPEFLGAGPDSC